ncbi:MAG TPA: hypothetical protein VMU34_06280, partial [Mycobacterium sp.]|nr:hypothetical protein [Mycobacterium sp.]
DPSLSGGLYSQLFNQSVLDSIYAQSIGPDATGTSYPGVSFHLLPPTYYSASSYLTTTVDYDHVAGSLVANPVDQAHQLIRLPDPAKSNNPNTLNIFLVDQLNLDYDGMPSGDPIHGFGLVTSNGAILDTGGHIDTVAHELAHNLGLADISTDPNNLLQATNRNLPASVSDPAIGKQIDLLSGANGFDQIATVNQPLFTVGLSLGEMSTTFPCIAGVSLVCGFRIVSNGPNPAEQLIGAKIRFLDGASLTGAFIDRPVDGVLGLTAPVADALGCNNSQLSTVPLSGGGIEVDISWAAGCMQSGVGSLIGITYAGTNAGNFYQPPLSVEFDFPGGVSSSGSFDATTGIATTTETLSVSGIDTSDIPGDGAFIVPDDVPEPASGTLFVGAVVMLAGGIGGWRRRQTDRG